MGPTHNSSNSQGTPGGPYRPTPNEQYLADPAQHYEHQQQQQQQQRDMRHHVSSPMQQRHQQQEYFQPQNRQDQPHFAHLQRDQHPPSPSFHPHHHHQSPPHLRPSSTYDDPSPSSAQLMPHQYLQQMVTLEQVMRDDEAAQMQHMDFMQQKQEEREYLKQQEQHRAQQYQQSHRPVIKGYEYGITAQQIPVQPPPQQQFQHPQRQESIRSSQQTAVPLSPPVRPMRMRSFNTLSDLDASHRLSAQEEFLSGQMGNRSPPPPTPLQPEQSRSSGGQSSSNPRRDIDQASHPQQQAQMPSHSNLSPSPLPSQPPPPRPDFRSQSPSLPNLTRSQSELDLSRPRPDALNRTNYGALGRRVEPPVLERRFSGRVLDFLFKKGTKNRSSHDLDEAYHARKEGSPSLDEAGMARFRDNNGKPIKPEESDSSSIKSGGSLTSMQSQPELSAKRSFFGFRTPGNQSKQQKKGKGTATTAASRSEPSIANVSVNGLIAISADGTPLAKPAIPRPPLPGGTIQPANPAPSSATAKLPIQSLAAVSEGKPTDLPVALNGKEVDVPVQQPQQQAREKPTPMPVAATPLPVPVARRSSISSNTMEIPIPSTSPSPSATYPMPNSLPAARSVTSSASRGSSLGPLLELPDIPPVSGTWSWLEDSLSKISGSPDDSPCKAAQLMGSRGSVSTNTNQSHTYGSSPASRSSLFSFSTSPTTASGGPVGSSSLGAAAVSSLSSLYQDRNSFSSLTEEDLRRNLSPDRSLSNDSESSPLSRQSTIHSVRSTKSTLSDGTQVSVPDVLAPAKKATVSRAGATFETDDPSHLFWVPAHLHPELHPSDFKMWAGSKKIEDPDLANANVDTTVFFPSAKRPLRRSKSFVERHVVITPDNAEEFVGVEENGLAAPDGSTTFVAKKRTQSAQAQSTSESKGHAITRSRTVASAGQYSRGGVTGAGTSAAKGLPPLSRSRKIRPKGRPNVPETPGVAEGDGTTKYYPERTDSKKYSAAHPLRTSSKRSVSKTASGEDAKDTSPDETAVTTDSPALSTSPPPANPIRRRRLTITRRHQANRRSRIYEDGSLRARSPSLSRTSQDGEQQQQNSDKTDAVGEVKVEIIEEDAPSNIVEVPHSDTTTGTSAAIDKDEEEKQWVDVTPTPTATSRLESGNSVTATGTNTEASTENLIDGKVQQPEVAVASVDVTTSNVPASQTAVVEVPKQESANGPLLPSSQPVQSITTIAPPVTTKSKKKKDGKSWNWLSGILGGHKKNGGSSNDGNATKAKRSRPSQDQRSVHAAQHHPDDAVHDDYNDAYPVDGDDNQPRLPLEVEKQIYRASHMKLAQHRRALLQQVLISNLMLYILSVHADVTFNRVNPRAKRGRRGRKRGSIGNGSGGMGTPGRKDRSVSPARASGPLVMINPPTLSGTTQQQQPMSGSLNGYQTTPFYSTGQDESGGRGLGLGVQLTPHQDLYLPQQQPSQQQQQQMPGSPPMGSKQQNCFQQNSSPPVSPSSTGGAEWRQRNLAHLAVIKSGGGGSEVDNHAGENNGGEGSDMFQYLAHPSGMTAPGSLPGSWLLDATPAVAADHPTIPSSPTLAQQSSRISPPDSSSSSSSSSGSEDDDEVTDPSRQHTNNSLPHAQPASAAQYGLSLKAHYQRPPSPTMLAPPHQNGRNNRRSPSPHRATPLYGAARAAAINNSNNRRSISPQPPHRAKPQVSPDPSSSNNTPGDEDDVPLGILQRNRRHSSSSLSSLSSVGSLSERRP
ncbi:hypothetical protein DFS34DRAFT_649225 [Phlyctochytrium arcticum]|nr:hypothetical protein DFS34DRAFT_649225 [Phlyctochytrium arcticum]